MGVNREDRGQATVEFVLVLPVLLMCVALIVQTGRVVALQIQLEAAAREGARAAAVEGPAAAGAAVGRVYSGATTDVAVAGVWIEVIVRSELELVWGVSRSTATFEADAVMRLEASG